MTDARSGPAVSDSLSPLRRVDVTRVNGGTVERASDVAAAEEPLEVRLHDRPFAVIMRTPGHDRELAAGFLLAEHVIAALDDLGAVEHCRHPDHEQVHHLGQVFLHGAAAARVPEILQGRRRTVANASCGVCGRATIESLRQHALPLTSTCRVPRDVILALPDALQAQQSVFEETGGLHAAGLFEADGQLRLAAEDVGRHNAVDKVVGAMLLADRLPLDDTILMVSGRVSFEIVEKAWAARIPIVAAVSAPSSLAIDLAHEAGITLIGFLRAGTFNIYAHGDRIV
jgi:FdhD protein